MAKLDEVLEAVLEVKTGVAVLNSQVGELKSQVDRLPTVEGVGLAIAARASECHKLFKHQRSSQPPENQAVMSAKAKVLLALAGFLGAAATLITMWATFHFGV